MNSRTPFSDLPYRRTDNVVSVLIDLGDVVAEMELLEQIDIHFLDSLPTVNRALVRHHNCVLGENRGDTGRVPFVECVVRLYAVCVKLLGYLWIKRVLLLGEGWRSKKDCAPYKGK